MDRLDYYFRQKVTEAELDEGFANGEAADWNFVVDADLVGVHFGLSCGEQGVPNMTLLMTAGAAYDGTGRRIRVPTSQNVDCSVDFNNVSTTVATVGNERWLSVFVGFTRALTDPRTDGNGLTVYFNRAETFELRVVAGVEAPAGTAVRPSLDATRILACDVLLAFGATALHNADVSVTRRQDIFVANGTAISLRQGRAKLAVSALLTFLDQHLTTATGAHAASAISYLGGGSWVDGTTNPATDVESQLDKIVSDLVATTGASRIGAAAVGGNFFFGTPGGDIAACLAALADYVDRGPLGTSTAAYSSNTVLTTERQVYADSSGGAFNLTLPAPLTGRSIRITDRKGTFGTNNVTLLQNGSEKILGIAASRALGADWGSYRVHSDGTDWFID